MTQDTTGAAAPVAEEVVAPATAPTSADTQTEDTAPQEAQQQESTEEDKAKEQGRVARRMQQLLRDRWQERGAREAAERQAAQLYEELQRIRGADPQASSTAYPEVPTQAPDPQAAYAAAAFDIKCNQIADQGAKAFPDFNDAMEAVRLAAPSGAVLRDALEAVVDADEPAKVLHYLGTHPEEAEQLFRLSPKAMARKLGALEARLAATPSKPPRTSNAPDPIKPIAARGSSANDLYDPNLSAKDWYRIREKQRAEGRK